MNFENLKLNFYKYIKETTPKTVSNSLSEKETENVSIFDDSKEFNEYVENSIKNIDEYNLDMNDLKQLNIKDGQIKILQDENTYIDEESQEIENFMVDLLNQLFKDENFITFFDKNNDRELDEKEILNFYNSIKHYDENIKNISLKDVLEALKDIKNETFKFEDERRLEEKKKTEAIKKRKSVRDNHISQGGFGSCQSNSRISKNNQDNPITKTLTLDELNNQKTTKEKEVRTAQEELNSVHNGENLAIKSKKEECEKLKKACDKAIEENKDISDELKQKRKENLENIEKKENEINKTNIDINNQKNIIANLNLSIQSYESNLSALKKSLSTLQGQKSNNQEVQMKINNKISSVQSQISENENKISESKKQLKNEKTKLSSLEENLKNQKAELEELNNEKEKIEEEILNNCNDKVKLAIENYNNAKTELEEIKVIELSKAEKNLKIKTDELNKINSQINIKKAEKISNDNKVSLFDFNFNENLIDNQEYALEQFKDVWENNKDTYKEVEEKTGIPAELIASIHWRESGCNFDTYLHNGDPLGQPTTHVPTGIYFDNWEDAAIDALSNRGSVDKNDIESYYEFAECYNGLGYRNQGLPSPYVWAGTDQYESGKYVADGVYDPSHVDTQLGVALMLKEIMS